LAVIRTEKGVYLAGYYSGTYADKPMSEAGLLISLKENRTFQLNPTSAKQKITPRGMVYDKYYIIFGNS
jgi:hypothetical protein